MPRPRREEINTREGETICETIEPRRRPVDVLGILDRGSDDEVAAAVAKTSERATDIAYMQGMEAGATYRQMQIRDRAAYLQNHGESWEDALRRAVLDDYGTAQEGMKNEP